MKVFELRYDLDTYQQLLPAQTDNVLSLACEGLPKAATWTKPLLYVDNPLLKVPDFWYTGSPGAVAFDPKKMPLEVYSALEEAGEWLPVRVEDGKDLVVLNVTQVVNALDKERTHWHRNAKGERMYIEFTAGSHAFHPERFGESSICKIPENNAVSILCLERSGDKNEEFKAAVEHYQLKGLKFNLFWEG